VVNPETFEVEHLTPEREGFQNAGSGRTEARK
jgi:hypothetical protein